MSCRPNKSWSWGVHHGASNFLFFFGTVALSLSPSSSLTCVAVTKSHEVREMVLRACHFVVWERGNQDWFPVLCWGPSGATHSRWVGQEVSTNGFESARSWSSAVPKQALTCNSGTRLAVLTYAILLLAMFFVSGGCWEAFLEACNHCQSDSGAGMHPEATERCLSLIAGQGGVRILQSLDWISCISRDSLSFLNLQNMVGIDPWTYKACYRILKLVRPWLYWFHSLVGPIQIRTFLQVLWVPHWRWKILQDLSVLPLSCCLLTCLS